MSSERPSTVLPASTQTARHVSPSPHGLRHRPLGRAATFAESPVPRRRSSFLSETLSETRRSLRSSTDDILLPRARGEDDSNDHEFNHWHSAPLVLALLPAVGGIFFTNGSAFITDVTLLALAAIFMNWALRSPWDWYRAAQSSVIIEPSSPSVFTPIEEDDEVETPKVEGTSPDADRATAKQGPSLKLITQDKDSVAAQRELRIYELMALFCCFACPLLAAWLLHAIRSQLTRPSEGLVSDYNLTIFILVAEVRPSAHLIKLIQRRTLFIQRRVHAESLLDSRRSESQQLRDYVGRLEELEAHVADRIAKSGSQDETAGDDEFATKISVLATTDVKKTIQPELDALNRAMRRYEKRITISSVQVEARLQDLETRLNDVVSLAAAAQRHAERRSDNYANILINWACALVVVPVQWVTYLASLPGKFLSGLISKLGRYVTKAPKDPKSSVSRDHRTSRKASSGRNAERERRVK